METVWGDFKGISSYWSQVLLLADAARHTMVMHTPRYIIETHRNNQRTIQLRRVPQVYLPGCWKKWYAALGRHYTQPAGKALEAEGHTVTGRFASLILRVVKCQTCQAKDGEYWSLAAGHFGPGWSPYRYSCCERDHWTLQTSGKLADGHGLASFHGGCFVANAEVTDDIWRLRPEGKHQNHAL